MPDKQKTPTSRNSRLGKEEFSREIFYKMERGATLSRAALEGRLYVGGATGEKKIRTLKTSGRKVGARMWFFAGNH